MVLKQAYVAYVDVRQFVLLSYLGTGRLFCVRSLASPGGQLPPLPFPTVHSRLHLIDVRMRLHQYHKPGVQFEKSEGHTFAYTGP